MDVNPYCLQPKWTQGRTCRQNWVGASTVGEADWQSRGLHKESSYYQTLCGREGAKGINLPCFSNLPLVLCWYLTKRENQGQPDKYRLSLTGLQGIEQGKEQGRVDQEGRENIQDMGCHVLLGLRITVPEDSINLSAFVFFPRYDLPVAAFCLALIWTGVWTDAKSHHSLSIILLNWSHCFLILSFCLNLFPCTFVRRSMWYIFWTMQVWTLVYLAGEIGKVYRILGWTHPSLNLEGMITAPSSSIQCCWWKVWSQDSFIFKWPISSFLEHF